MDTLTAVLDTLTAVLDTLTAVLDTLRVVLDTLTAVLDTLPQARDLLGNAEFFGRVCEIGRRFKITNPEKLRTTYGKLIYLMQVASPPAALWLLELV